MDYDRMFSEAEDPGVAHFTASYDSTCPCGDEILAGDKAGYLPGEDVASCASCCGLK